MRIVEMIGPCAHNPRAQCAECSGDLQKQADDAAAEFGGDALQRRGVADGIAGELHRLEGAEDDQRTAQGPERGRRGDQAAED